MVPETLEPSLQLASAVLSQLNMPSDEVSQAIQNFRKNHVAELQVIMQFNPYLGFIGIQMGKKGKGNFHASCTESVSTKKPLGCHE